MESFQNLGQGQQDALDHALACLYSAETPQGFEAAWRAAIQREEKLQMKSLPKKKPFHRFWRVAIPAAAALVLVAGAQWVGGNVTQEKDSISMQRSAVYSANDSSAGAGWAEKESYETEMYFADTGALDDATGGYGRAMIAETGLTPSPTAPPNAEGSEQERKLVRTVDITLATTSFDADEQAVRDMVESSGGYVESMYQYGDGATAQQRRITFNLRIPADRLDSFLAGAAGIGRVTGRSETTMDRTVQYSDTSLRLQTQRDKMTRLSELLIKAETVSELLEIENEIANTQYQIDSYETSLRGIDREVLQSAVSVTLMEETPAQSAAETSVSLGDRIRNGLSASLKGTGQFFQNMLVFIVMALPVLVPLAALGVALWLVARRRRAAHARPDTKTEYDEIIVENEEEREP